MRHDVDPRVLFPAEWEQRWRELVADGQVDQAVFELVDRHTHVPLDVVQEKLAGVIKVDGPFVFEVEPNIVVWAGMSREFAAVIQRLLNAPKPRPFEKGFRLHVRRISADAYAIRQLALPLVTVLRKPRATPHWYPMILCHSRDVPTQERRLILREDASLTRFVVRRNPGELHDVWRGHVPPETVLGGQAT